MVLFNQNCSQFLNPLVRDRCDELVLFLADRADDFEHLFVFRGYFHVRVEYDVFFVNIFLVV